MEQKTHTQNTYKHKIAVLISGQGSTLKNLLEHNKAEKLRATVAIVVSSHANAGGLQIAQEWGIPTKTVSYAEHKDNIESYSEKITEHIKPYKVDLVVLAGFMSRYIAPKEFERRVISMHPSLFPYFCGKGFYGRRVHEAVYKAVQESDLRETGCTVHYVDPGYDEGAVIRQGSVSVSREHSVEDIRQRVGQLERTLYPQVIQDLLEQL